ncbi:DUF1624 domain-containing protein [Curtobacterium aetherium]|uniref:DUF1624 domain-containing protein n=1 Tax=Curtobacterium aetherium TaxID=2841594 RepID=A0ACD1E1W7_9MICO|nr:DUF1624 domain-containing protein [Curtobacterium sp. L6-1]QWS32797.1 DUF1624 domain-containing protein [Curtobacterium sp. L6-1]
MTRTAQRLIGLDAARGLAVLGMIAAHLGPPHADLDLGDPSTWLSSSTVAPRSSSPCAPGSR